MRYLSVCSGIEAATVGWHQLGWEPVGFAEIEPFPSAVLAHHYPTVKNFGDMSNYKEWNLGTVDLLVGGTPCQSFSVAGLRKGLADPRGNLALVYCGILDHFRPQWCVWENVPGVLSSNGGRDFGSFLGALAELGYGFAYRVLDAQYFGVAQRRRRVFVVGYLGDWRPAAEVLFEPESLRRDTAPSREAGQKVAGTFKARANSGGWGSDVELAAGEYMQPVTARMVAFGEYVDDGTASAMKARDYKDATDLVTQPISYALQGAGHTSQNSQGSGWNEEVSFTLNRLDVHGVAQPIAFSRNDDGRDATNDLSPTMRVAGRAGGMLSVVQPIAPTLTATNDPSRSPQSTEVTNQVAAVHAVSMAVRRLTPVECERLQGFPDNYTNIPWRKQPESPDGPRYKALGNSMAVPVMGWIGKRIQQFSH
jgi:DNA (cytosine-5)-methyltransferase 1